MELSDEYLVCCAVLDSCRFGWSSTSTHFTPPRYTRTALRLLSRTSHANYPTFTHPRTPRRPLVSASMPASRNGASHFPSRARSAVPFSAADRRRVACVVCCRVRQVDELFNLLQFIEPHKFYDKALFMNQFTNLEKEGQVGTGRRGGSGMGLGMEMERRVRERHRGGVVRACCCSSEMCAPSTAYIAERVKGRVLTCWARCWLDTISTRAANNYDRIQTHLVRRFGEK